MKFISAASQSMKNPANVLLFPPCSLSMVAFSGTEERRPEEGSWRTHLIRQSVAKEKKSINTEAATARVSETAAATTTATTATVTAIAAATTTMIATMTAIAAATTTMTATATSTAAAAATATTTRKISSFVDGA